MRWFVHVVRTSRRPDWICERWHRYNNVVNGLCRQIGEGVDRLFQDEIGSIEDLVDRIDERYRSVWAGKTAPQQTSLARYFLPHASSKPVLCPTRPRVVKWYCPFAHQHAFPSGHRYCINVYTGCAHGCTYCYAAAYEPPQPAAKRDFAKMLLKDMADLERFDVPPAPIHLSNSTDPFQPMEARAGHTRLALEQILAHRQRFTSVVILTKNPKLAVELGCVDLFRQLGLLGQDHPNYSGFARTGAPALLVEVSIAFWRESPCQAYDPGAPGIGERMEGIRLLRRAGIPVALRIDPLFPREPLLNNSGRTYRDFGLCEPQTLDDLERLVAFAKKTDAYRVVYSPAKIVQPRTRPLSQKMRSMRSLYQCVAAPERLIFRGGSWRLPPERQSAVTGPLLGLCRGHGVPAKCCMQNLIETP